MLCLEAQPGCHHELHTLETRPIWSPRATRPGKLTTFGKTALGVFMPGAHEPVGVSA